MPENLDEAEIRVLGSLVEKQLTTPEYYPLTLNALTAACNQKSNRDPVVVYDEAIILGAIDSLRERNLVYLHYGSTSRTVKYKHMLPSVYDLDPAGTAVMGVLMLRGPQTLGEIRERSGRLFEFGSIAEVSEKLDELTRRDQPLVVKLERQPGQKDPRYAHLLAGPVAASAIVNKNEIIRDAASGSKIAELEQDVGELKNDLAEFRREFSEFRRQFD